MTTSKTTLTKSEAKTIQTKKPTSTKKTNFLHKIFGELNMSWPIVIIFAIAMGVYTALMAMLVPDGNSFHDIAVTAEWWVLPAILVIVNCKKPSESALKVFVFFLISQPLVYLIQVPFNSMGWQLFGYYPYWFKITLPTLPAGFIAWYMKKDQWYSGLILSSMTIFLAYVGLGIVRGFDNDFPNHLLTLIYCFGIIPIFIFGIFHKWQPRIITTIITVVATIIFAVAFGSHEKYDSIYRSGYDTADGTIVQFEFGDEPFVSFWSGEKQGNIEIINAGDLGYTLKLSGEKGFTYRFSITDNTGHEYNYRYFFDQDQNTLILELDD